MAIPIVETTESDLLAELHLPRRPLTVSDYERMVAAGVLRDDERLELIAGEIIAMSPIGPRHAVCVNKLVSVFNRRLPETQTAQAQGPLRLDEVHEVQPDVLILRASADSYAAAKPVPADVLLVVEVSDSTLDYDRRLKLALYAQAGVPEVWIINLGNDTLERYHHLLAGSYSETQVIARGGLVPQALLPGPVLLVDAILPPPATTP